MKGSLSVLVWVGLVCVLGATSGAWIGNVDDETRFCRSVCDKCGCVGFSCGEECLCECHQKKVGDRYMACITDARSASEPINEMNYDIVVQGPNGNSRISRSVVTKDVNPEEVFPSDFVFNAAEDGYDEDVAAPAATPNNIARGFEAIKTFEFRKLEIPSPPPPPAAPTFKFKSFDVDAVKTHFADLKLKLDEQVQLYPLPEVQPVSIAPLPALPKHSLHHIQLPELSTLAPPPPPPAPTVRGEHFQKLKDFLSRPLEFKETLTVTH